MTAASTWPAADEDLPSVYEASLRAAGMRSDEPALQGVGEFVRQVGSAQQWTVLSPQAKQALSSKCRAFVSWLLVTGRATSPVDYLVTARPRLGVTARHHYPDEHARFVAQGAALGFSSDSVTRQWNLLAQIGALHAVPPHRVDEPMVKSASSLLRAAFATINAEHAGKCLSNALFQLQRTLFHTGVINALPRKNGPDKSAGRRRAWADAPVELAATARRYLDQVALSLRPATIVHAEQSLRELIIFCSQHHPEVRRVADLRRQHLEQFKTWLAEQPGRAGRLHKRTVAMRLGDLRVFFERITQWGWEDAPTCVLLFNGDNPILVEPSSPPVRQRPRGARPDHQGRPGPGAGHARRSSVLRITCAGSAARLLSTGQGPAGLPGRHRRHRPQDDSAVLAPRHQGRGLRVRPAQPRCSQASQARARRRCGVTSGTRAGSDPRLPHQAAARSGTRHRRTR